MLASNVGISSISTFLDLREAIGSQIFEGSFYPVKYLLSYSLNTSDSHNETPDKGSSWSVSKKRPIWTLNSEL